MNDFDFDAEPHNDDAAYTWTRYDIKTGCPGPKSVVVFWSTNDDNDDGYPDDRDVSDSHAFVTLEEALRFTGKTHVGFYGQPVTVTLNGELVL